MYHAAKLAVALVLVLAACKSKSTKEQPRPQDPAQVAIPYVPPDATVYIPPGTQVTPPPPVQNTELQAALDALRADTERDIPPTAWWQAHAAEVRPVLTAWLADGRDDGIGDRRALRILGEIGEPGDVEVLSHVLTTWETDESRAAAAAALAIHRETAATRALVDASKLDDTAIALHAVTGLGGRKGDPDARKRLEELRDHPDQAMRSRAAKALRELTGAR